MVFTTSRKVMFKDCDPAGIVFYPRYFEMVNDVVETYFDEVLAMPFTALHTDHAVPTVTLTAQFMAASRHGDILTFTISPTRVGGASLDLTVVARCEHEDRIKVDLTVVHVTKAMKSLRWPDAVRGRLTDDLTPELKEETHG